MRIAAGLCAALVAGTASADTLACQYTRSTGFIFQNGNWVTTNFNLEKPFFLKINGDHLDSASTQKVLGLGTSICSYTDFGPQGCTDSGGDYIYFNERTLRGAVSMVAGSGEPDSDLTRDTVGVSMFICERI